MHVRSIKLRNYRNYYELDLALSPGINIFLGANAQGKTNIVEAVCYASLGRSHRTHADADLIRWQEEQASLELAFERRGVVNKLAFEFCRSKRRRILLNGQPIPLKELVGNLNTVLFSPEDLFLIKGAPAGRRRFLDGEISQASPAYYHELLQYNRILSQRNTLLKRIRERRADASMLELWDVQLAASAEKITRKRQEAVRKLNMLANLMQRRISGDRENLSVTYGLSGLEQENMTKPLASWYNEMLEKSRSADILRGSTSIGPHHDDVLLFVNGINLRTFGSQGQQRTGVLSLKLAELEFLRSETGEYPILLLDDVMSELDAQRRHQLLDFIRRERIQTLITATDAAYFPQERFGTYYQVKQGTVSR
ncbi:DNA replication/repair protein RecF [Mitsuokella sp.]|uniref:DNA replication/repair protein RecF n=1 Tax=Mitsuokella TaxID=52225 RepID=UPI002A81BEC9|nr:DNA replication/repair protein RecF [Mitsuokella sp.]MDY4474837.1 DNA replication/repair protein RecF [Mitsuokella sp.]